MGKLLCRLFGHKRQWVWHEASWLGETIMGWRPECRRCGRHLKW